MQVSCTLAHTVLPFVALVKRGRALLAYLYISREGGKGGGMFLYSQRASHACFGRCYPGLYRASYVSGLEARFFYSVCADAGTTAGGACLA